jgi:chromodomain-helicase-DNA-binding protein 4
MSEIIIPLSMSSVQKELYKSIVSQNADLMKSITARVEKGAQPLKSAAPKLQNILVQLRKCLAHPFVHSPDLEERDVEFEQEMRALVEASGKLSFLSKLLPKLKEQGHRCLIFSQFLDCLNILEDFLAGIGFNYGRLDGDTATSDRQQMIDAFNAPDSKMDCFLLSTRAGGSGINLGILSVSYVTDLSNCGYRYRLRSRSQPTSRFAGSC